MANINLATRYLPGETGQPANLIDLTEQFRRRDNAVFLAEVAVRLEQLAQHPGPAGTGFDASGAGCIGLIGEYGLIGYAIRRAQEVLRDDQTPSYWSHAFLFADGQPGLSKEAATNRSGRNSAWIWESTLEPAGLFNQFTNRNGVGPRRIGDYAQAEFKLLSAHCVPNIAVLAIGLTPKERADILDRANDPDVVQMQYDILGLLGTWYRYLTHRAEEPNPLATGHAIYCSAYVQLAYDAAAIDLAPGAHQRNTAPEHLWQGVKYFQQTYRVADPATGELAQRPLAGWFCLRDKACLVTPVDEPLPRTIRDLFRELNPE